MCGIIGITKTKKTNNLIGSQIYEALTRLEYRGYDSVGMAVISKDGIELAKDKGSINEVGEKLNFSEYEGSTAIGHSRWATHGAVEKRNAHPHKSNDGKVVVVGMLTGDYLLNPQGVPYDFGDGPEINNDTGYPCIWIDGTPHVLDTGGDFEVGGIFIR